MSIFKKKESKKKTVRENRPEKQKQYIQHAGGCIVTKSILQGDTVLKWLFREESVHEADNGWRAIGADDTQEYVDNSANHTICDFNTLANIEPAVLNVYEMPVGTELELREDASGKYFLETNTGQEIREKVKSPLQFAFEQNLKFISQDKLDAGQVKAVFESEGQLRYFTIEGVAFPSGKLIVADPLCYLQSPKNISVLAKEIAPGEYPITLAVMDSKIAGIRIVGAKMKIVPEKAVKYELAEALRQKDEKWEKTLAGFPVETGTACFCDEKAAEGYWNFLSKWYGENPNGNLYDDYFSRYFAESYEKAPEYQRPGGDFILWNNPEDGTQLAMFASGLGDGYYCPYWGMDANEKICELVILFMNPELF